MKINIGQLLSNRAYLNPGMEAFIGDNYRYNFRDVNERANRFAALLIKRGIRSGDRIAVFCKNNEEATAAVIWNSYYRSGDLGKIDEEGFLSVVDRLKDMIISGSENIYPAELEQVIKGHPGVAEVAVVGKPDAKWGEIPLAFIVKKVDVTVSEQEIMSLCRQNLAGYKCVREIRFIDAIPKNAVGKVLKKELRKQIN